MWPCDKVLAKRFKVCCGSFKKLPSDTTHVHFVSSSLLSLLSLYSLELRCCNLGTQSRNYGWQWNKIQSSLGPWLQYPHISNLYRWGQGKGSLICFGYLYWIFIELLSFFSFQLFFSSSLLFWGLGQRCPNPFIGCISCLNKKKIIVHQQFNSAHQNYCAPNRNMLVVSCY